MITIHYGVIIFFAVLLFLFVGLCFYLALNNFLIGEKVAKKAYRDGYDKAVNEFKDRDAFKEGYRYGLFNRSLQNLFEDLTIKNNKKEN